MAISSFGRGDKGGNGPSAAAASGGANLSAFIDQGSEFEGTLTFKDTVRIDGRFRGEISSENTLIVGESGTVEATIRSNTVVVSGSVAGNIIAGHQVVLHKTGKVHGDVTAPSLIIEEGAVFNGQISMGSSEGKAASPGGSLKAVQGGGSKPADSPKPNGGRAPS